MHAITKRCRVHNALVKGSGLSQVHISVCVFWAAYVTLHTGVLMDMSC